MRASLIRKKDARIPLAAAKYNDTGSMVERGNSKGPRRQGSTSFEFTEGGTPRETLLESGGPESEATVIARYLRTGKHLGKFTTPRAADDYAKRAAGRARKK